MNHDDRTRRMDSGNTCNSKLVSQGRFCSLTYCDHCHLYQLHMGPLSLKLDTDLLRHLSEMMMQVYLARFDDSARPVAVVSKPPKH